MAEAAGVVTSRAMSQALRAVFLGGAVVAGGCRASSADAVPVDAAPPAVDTALAVADAPSAADVAVASPDAATADRSPATDEAAVDPPGTYSAVEVFGADKIVTVVKRTATFCVFLYLWDAHDGSPKGLNLPPGWGVSELRAMQPPEACDPHYLGGVEHQHDATSQTGTITFAPVLPWTIQSVSVDLAFANPPPWCPQHVSFRATNLVVQRLP
jgi:hypothetical protein